MTVTKNVIITDFTQVRCVLYASKIVQILAVPMRRRKKQTNQKSF